MADSPAATARAHAEGGRAGTLGTISADPATGGYPFGSVVPYALDDAGGPIVRIADIAQHTRNLKADPRASLLVRPEPTAGDPQATWRVTLLGRMEALQEGSADLDAARDRYRSRFPDVPAEDDGSHGVRYWRMEVVRVRFIGGFGSIHWIEPDDYRRARSVP